jgi:hypothetical protein
MQSQKKKPVRQRAVRQSSKTGGSKIEQWA